MVLATKAMVLIITITDQICFFFLFRVIYIWYYILVNKKLYILAAGFLGVIIVGLLTVIGIFIYVAKDLPNPNKLVRQEGFSTKIYDRKGKLLYDVYENQRRVPVTIGQIPLALRQATIAIEDKNFYQHQGFDFLGWMRAMFRIVWYRKIQGGSTITQQLVKTVLLDSSQTITRKVKEFILTLQVESKFSKDEILQMYLNEVPYGGMAYGVEAASEMYFNKSVSQLNLAESVILAGLPQSPSNYSPFRGTAYLGRAKEVARRMREEGFINTDEEKKLLADLPSVAIASQSGYLKAAHFVFYVKELLIEKYGERLVEQGGLRVDTTLDLDLQEEAQKIVAEEIGKVKYLNINNGAAIVINPKNGEILAMVGSRDWFDPLYDGKFNVVTASRQPGSAIKPVTYLTGLRNGYTAAYMLMDTKTSFPGGDKPEYTPENYDGKFRGPVTVRDALGNSLNIPAVKMLSLVGIKNMLKMGYDMGLTTLEPTDKLLARVGLSVTLGGGEVKLIDLASAYSAFANGGNKVLPQAILKVTDKDGKILEIRDQKTEIKNPVITPEEAYIISSILSDQSARSITFGTRSLINITNRTVAVKTGTTNDKRDNWTIGWTPQIMTGVWVGNNDNSSMKQVASGITGASPIWNKIITRALKGLPREEFATASGMVLLDVDRFSGYPAHDGFESRKEYFIAGTEPIGIDPYHRMVKLCKGEEKLATPADIGAKNYIEKEYWYFKEEDPFQNTWKPPTNKWQEGILNWLATQADPKYHPPTEPCGNTNPVWITIFEPQEKTRINTNDIKVRVNIDTVNNPVKMEVYLDGSLLYTINNAPWEITIPNVSNGKHHIEVKAWDDKGFGGSRNSDFAVNEDY